MNLNIGNNIRAHRTRLNLTQEELAKLLSVKQNTISAFESGKRLPDLLITLHMSELFGVSMDELACSPAEVFPSAFNGEDVAFPAGTKPPDTAEPIVIYPQALRSYAEHELLTTFRLLDYANKMILLGDSQKLLSQQRKTEKAAGKRRNK